LDAVVARHGRGRRVGEDKRSPLWAVVGIDTVAVVAAVVVGLLRGNPAKEFGERHSMTFFSSLQLLAVAWVSWDIYRIRRPGREGSVWRSQALIWALMAAGFVFLALDDLLMIHEKTDKLVHALLGMRETPLSSHLDDMLVALYGIVGLVLLVVYRREVLRFLTVRGPLLVAFVLAFAMMAVGAANKRRFDIFGPYMNEARLMVLHRWSSVVEDSLKVFAEGLFLVAFVLARRRARHGTHETHPT